MPHRHPSIDQTNNPLIEITMKINTLIVATTVSILGDSLHAQNGIQDSSPGDDNGIQIISQGYTLNGGWGVSWYAIGDTVNGFYSTPVPYPSSYPLSGGFNLTSTDGNAVAMSTAGPGLDGFTVLTASASIGQDGPFSLNGYFFASREGGNPGYYNINGTYVQGKGSAYCNESANWLFSPTGNEMTINLGVENGHIGSSYASLFNETTGVPVGLWNGNGGGFYNSTFAVTPGDVYQLYASGDGVGTLGGGDDGGINFSATISSTSVPEPDFFALFTLSGGCLVWFRSLRKRA
jgi:hypothetical protein